MSNEKDIQIPNVLKTKYPDAYFSIKPLIEKFFENINPNQVLNLKNQNDESYISNLVELEPILQVPFSKKTLALEILIKEENYYFNNELFVSSYFEIFKEFVKYCNELEIDKFHKAIDQKNNWIQFKKCKNFFDINHENNYLLKIIAYYFTVELFQESCKFLLLELETPLKTPLKDINPREEEVENLIKKKFKIRTSKEEICNSILLKIENFFFIYSNSFQIKINIKSAKYFILKFLLRLQANEKILVKSFTRNKSTDKKNSKPREVFSFSLMQYHHDAFFIENIFLNSGSQKSQPLLFLNKFLESSFYEKQTPYLILDNIFNIFSPINQNPGYGYYETEKTQNKLYNNINKINPSNFSELIYNLNKVQRTSKTVKKTANQYFSKTNTSLFWQALRKWLNSPVYIETPSFKQNLQIFIEKNFKNENLNVKIDFDTNLVDLMSIYYLIKDVQATKNKTLILNLFYLIHLILLFKENGKNPFFYPFFLDFRGRKYYDSIVSITGVKLIRYSLNLGSYSETEMSTLINQTKKTKTWDTTLNLIKTKEIDLSDFDLENSSLFQFFKKKNEEDMGRLLYIEQLKSAASIFKSEILGKFEINNETGENEIKYFCTISDFLKLGYKKLKEFERDPDLFLNSLKEEDSYKIIHIHNFLYKEIDFYKKTLASGDVSASGHLIRFVITQLVDVENYKFINLTNSNLIFDPYSWFIHQFFIFIKNIYNDEKIVKKFSKSLKGNIQKIKNEFNTYKDYESFFIKIFKRKTLKKILMTIEYNASSLTIIDYFWENFDTFEKDNLKKNNESIKASLMILKFFMSNLHFIKNFETIDTINRFFTTIKDLNYKLTLSDGFELNFAKFNQITSRQRIVYRHKKEGKSFRYTACITIFSSIHDNSQTFTSTIPNMIHSIDGLHIRLLTLFLPNNSHFLSIHDEFYYDYVSFALFKDTLNHVVKINFSRLIDLNDVKTPSTISNSKIFEKIKNCFCTNIII